MVANESRSEAGMPIRDEEWWASLLAEEERYSPPGYIQQSRKDETPRVSADWKQAKALFQQDEIVTLQVTGYNRGGLLVEGNGLYGFVPYSHLVNMQGHNEVEDRDKLLETYVGRSLRLKVIECIPEDGRVVFSERAARAQAGRRTELFETLQPGQRVEGQVTNITDFGVFVDLGGVEGLIHISELSWGRVNHPGQVVELGQSLEVQVIDVSPERCRVALSLKRLFENPWDSAETDFTVNQIAPAVITSIVSYGAFARLEQGLEGLIHVSEMPLGASMLVQDFLKEGQQVDVRILHVDAAHQRMGLSLKLTPEA
jgi:small subunit ribosomal protein S1